MTERWLPVPGYEAIYEVSDQGQVKRVAGGRGARIGHILRAGRNTDGYLHVNLFKPGELRRSYGVHRLVTAAFLGSRPSDLDVNHINGVKTDNRLANLEYATHGENMRHAFWLGLKRRPRGEENPNASLVRAQVLQIRAMAHAGTPQTEIARQFGVSGSTINHIVSRRNWAHIPELEDESEDIEVDAAFAEVE